MSKGTLLRNLVYFNLKKEAWEQVKLECSVVPWYIVLKELDTKVFNEVWQKVAINIFISVKMG